MAYARCCSATRTVSNACCAIKNRVCCVLTRSKQTPPASRQSSGRHLLADKTAGATTDTSTCCTREKFIDIFCNWFQQGYFAAGTIATLILFIGEYGDDPDFNGTAYKNATGHEAVSALAGYV